MSTLDIQLLDKHTDSTIVRNYFKCLVNRIFKILPMWENKESSIVSYIESLQCELVGCKNLIRWLECDSYFVTLLAVLQYLKDTPECEQREVKREVFKAISICNKLHSHYDFKEVDE